MTFMTIRETSMHRHIMGFTMAGTTFLNNLVPILVTVHALQPAVFTRIKLLTGVLIFMTAAAQL